MFGMYPDGVVNDVNERRRNEKDEMMGGKVKSGRYEKQSEEQSMKPSPWT